MPASWDETDKSRLGELYFIGYDPSDFGGSDPVQTATQHKYSHLRKVLEPLSGFFGGLTVPGVARTDIANPRLIAEKPISFGDVRKNHYTNFKIDCIWDFQAIRVFIEVTCRKMIRRHENPELRLNTPTL